MLYWILITVAETNYNSRDGRPIQHFVSYIYMEHLQSKYQGTGHADATKFELAVHQHRSSPSHGSKRRVSSGPTTGTAGSTRGLHLVLFCVMNQELWRAWVQDARLRPLKGWHHHPDQGECPYPSNKWRKRSPYFVRWQPIRILDLRSLTTSWSWASGPGSARLTGRAAPGSSSSAALSGHKNRKLGSLVRNISRSVVRVANHHFKTKHVVVFRVSFCLHDDTKIEI